MRPGLKAAQAAGLVTGLACALAPSVAWSQASVEAQTGSEKRPFAVKGTAQFRTLAVRDEDPENDQYLLYVLTGYVDVFERAKVFVTMGFNQFFTAEQDESAIQLRDSAIGFLYATPIELSADMTLMMRHEASVYLPTSEASQFQDLYAAPQLRTVAMLETMPGLTLSLVPRARYRFHQFAERAGPYGAPQNIRYELEVGGGVDYELFRNEAVGGFNAGTDAYSTWVRKYPDREGGAIWQQFYGWDVYLAYNPWKTIVASVAMAQNGSVLRNGVVNTFFTHRDETELVFSVSGTY